MNKPIFYKIRPKLKEKTNFVDAYSGALEELFFFQHPKFKKTQAESKHQLRSFLKNQKVKDIWIHYPQTKTLVHTINENDYFKLRTARNRNLITEKEQQKFREMVAGIAGLSVGSSILSSLVVSGGPKRIKIADFDALEVTNLNRIRARLADVGKNKTLIAASEVWGLDPFAKLWLFKKGINQTNLKDFFFKKPALNVFIDQIDSLPLKLETRLLCRQKKIPVLMATDNGDSVILDIERFDLEPKREIFHGALGRFRLKNFENLDYKKWLSLATKIVRPEFLTAPMQSSLLQIGKTLPAVPQLGATAGVAGATVSLALRRIANKQSMPSGRYIISLEEKLMPDFNNKKNIAQRKKQTAKFIKTLH